MTRKTIVALIVFGVLLAITLVVELTPEHREEIAWSIPKLSDTLDRIEITRKGTTVVLEKKGDQWAITAPKVYEASKSAVEGVLKLFERPIGMDLKVVPKKEELERFKVAGDEAITVKLSAGGKQVVAFVVGKTVGSRTFIQPLDQKDVVYRARASLRWKLDKDLDDWREKKILDVDRDRIAKLKFTPGEGQPYALEKKGDTWSIVAPDEAKADGSTVSSLTSSLAALRAATFADDVPLEKTGLKDHPFVIEVWTRPEGEDGKPTTDGKLEGPVGIEIGGQVGEDLLEGKYKDDYFVRRIGHPQVFVVRSYSVKNVRKRLSQLKDRQMLKLRSDDVVGITIRRKSDTLSFQKKDSKWTATEPKSLVDALDTTQVSALVASITSMRATEVVEGKTPEQAGLAGDLPASALVEIQLQSGTTKTLRIGKKEGSPPAYFARLDDEPTIYKINDYTARKFLREAVAFKKVKK